LRGLTRLVALQPARASLLARIVGSPAGDADGLRQAGDRSDNSAEFVIEPDAEAG